MRSTLVHPFGLTILVSSVLLAGIVEVLVSGRGGNQSAWVLIWGISSYAASVLVMRPGINGLPLLDINTAQSLDELTAAVERCKAETLQRLRIDSLEHPTTLVPAVIAIGAAIYAWLVVPAYDDATWAIALALASAIACGASVTWRVTWANSRPYENRVSAMQDQVIDMRRQIEQREIEERVDALREGFGGIDFIAGAKAIDSLVEEYGKLQGSLQRHSDSGPLSLSAVPELASEAYVRGIAVLLEAMQLAQASGGSDRERLRAEAATLQEQIEKAGEHDDVAVQRSILASHLERLNLLDRLYDRVGQLLYQAQRSEAALHRTRIQLASMAAGGSDTGVNAVIDALRQTIRRAEEVQEQMSRLGY